MSCVALLSKLIIVGVVGGLIAISFIFYGGSHDIKPQGSNRQPKNN